MSHEYKITTWSDIIIHISYERKLWLWNFTARRFNSCFIQMCKKINLKHLLKFSFEFSQKVCLCQKGRFSNTYSKVKTCMIDEWNALYLCKWSILHLAIHIMLFKLPVILLSSNSFKNHLLFSNFYPYYLSSTWL